jgi:hypothetical protein
MSHELCVVGEREMKQQQLARSQVKLWATLYLVSLPNPQAPSSMGDHTLRPQPLLNSRRTSLVDIVYAPETS